MPDKVRGSTSSLILVILVALSLAGGSFYLFQKEREKNQDLQAKIEELDTKQKMTEKKLAEAENASAQLQLKLKESVTQMDALRNELQQEKTAKEEALTNIEKIKADLDQQRTLRADLEEKVSEAQDVITKAQVQLKQLELQKMQLESKLKDIEEQSSGVELGKIVVGPEESVTVPENEDISTEPVTKKKNRRGAAAALEGKVLVINKDYNFAVINLGSKDGINIGDVLLVYHNNRHVGDIKIEKVHDSMAAAGFTLGDIKNKIYEGDKVVQKVK
jgi:hypothetical protein